jgi:glutamate-1-semialdehyde 2,1-aminomutase
MTLVIPSEARNLLLSATSGRRSAAHHARATALFPGGVNSPVRAFGSVGGTPPFIACGRGAHVFDVDGRDYVDYVLAYGPLILGHAHPAVVTAVAETAARGTAFGAPSPLEIRLAELVCAAVPSMQRVRFVNSGTEATMSAVRLARAYTGRSLIVKFDGHYHGHADTTYDATDGRIVSIPFNDNDAVQRVFERLPAEIAAVILEPVAGNIGVIPPRPGFLRHVRELCHRHGSVLIFDEVMTGFRVHRSSAQALYDVTPDLTTLGKVIGGGLPVGAFGGRAEIMSLVAPQGPLYQGGTFSGNPLTMAAGIACLLGVGEPGVWERIDSTTATLANGISTIAARLGEPLQVQRVGTMLSLFFTRDPVTDYAGAQRADRARYARFFHSMLRAGVYLPPSQLEAWFVSSAHTTADIHRTLEAAAAALAN